MRFIAAACDAFRIELSASVPALQGDNVASFLSSSSTSRTNQVQTVLVIVLLFNLAVAFAKFIYGTVSGLSSVQADGVHSLFDSAGNVVGIFGVLIASRPPDETHPYGHAKFETYASVVIGIMLVFAACEVGSEALDKLAIGSTGAVEPFSFALMIATLGVNVFVSQYERRRAIELKSEVLAADARHTLSDVFVSIGVLASLGLVALGYPIADPIMTLLVMLAILKAAYEVFSVAIVTLSDHVVIPVEELRGLAMSVEGVEDTHHERSRGSESEIYCDLHVLVDEGMTVGEAHRVAEAVERAIKEARPEVKEALVHIEPNDGHVD